MELSHEQTKAKLQSYIDADPRLGEVLRYFRQRLDQATNLTAHNWEHAYRDVINAIIIGEAEGADMVIVLPAAALHDIGFLYGAIGATHGAVGAEKLPEFLGTAGINYSKVEIAHMADCIRTHKGSLHNEKPVSLEAKVVADADLQEKFGPFGIYQYIRTFSEFNYPLEKILSRKQQLPSITLETETGRKLADAGRNEVTDFFNRLTTANQIYGDYEL